MKFYAHIPLYISRSANYTNDHDALFYFEQQSERKAYSV